MSNDRSLGRLRLSACTLRCLLSAGIQTIDHLRRYSDEDLLALPEFGEGCLKEVRNQLAAFAEYEVSIALQRSSWQKRPKPSELNRSQASPPSSETSVAPSDKEQIILGLHQQGYTPRQIAQELGISRQRVYTYLERLGCSPNQGRQPAIFRAHREGLLPQQIAEQLQTSLSSVYRCLQRQGCLPHRSSQQHSTWRGVVAWHLQGYPPKQIARKLGLTTQTVYWHLRRLGLTANTAHNPDIPADNETTAYEDNLEALPDRFLQKS